MNNNEKIKKDEQDVLSINQKEAIYNNNLMPIKAKISQILLYDQEAALEFLQEYNYLVKNGESFGTDIINKIVDLEFKIEQYEKERGKVKLSNEQVETIVKIIDDLLEKEASMETVELQEEFFKVKEIYKNISKKATYLEKDIIEPKLFLLQAQLLIRKVRDGAIELYNDISKEDIAGLTLAINAKINELMQNTSKEEQDRINQIKIEMIDREDFVYDPKIWSMLDTQNSKQKLNNNLQVSTKETQRVESLVPVQVKSNGFQFPSIGIFRRKTKKIKNRMRKHVYKKYG